MHKVNSSHLRPMPPRDTKETHRAATPLELFFDLVFVIAIAAAAVGLHHSVAEAHFVDGITPGLPRLTTMTIHCFVSSRW